MLDVLSISTTPECILFLGYVIAKARKMKFRLTRWLMKALYTLERLAGTRVFIVEKLSERYHLKHTDSLET